MNPDDPRHGTPAGYQAHWRDSEDPCDACAAAKYRYGKRIRVETHNGERMHYSADELHAVLEPWLAMGLSPSAIATAAGLDGQRSSHFAKTMANGTSVRRGTYLRLAAITEDDFAGAAKVYADLTRQRVYSLMAIGHRLADMPINRSGQWRHRAHVTVESARVIRDYYRDHEAKIGPDRTTQARARNAGHRPPLAWDDPGTLAWPNGRPIITAAPITAPSRAGILTDLADQGAGISRACAELKISPASLQKWCERHDMSDVFARLKGRENAGQEYRNQWTADQHERRASA